MSYEINTLLIVDDEELICRGLLRQFRGRFDRVYTATHPCDAERILAEVPVTDLICDYNLGETVPYGTDLLIKWRRDYPQIRRAVIFSGADLSRVSMEKSVDAAISKSAPPEDLVAALMPLTDSGQIREASGIEIR